MTLNQAKQAVARKAVIQFISDTSRWGIATALSDDGSTIYYQPRGAGLTRSATTIDKVEVSK